MAIDISFSTLTKYIKSALITVLIGLFIIILSVISVVLETEKTIYVKFSDGFFYLNYFFAIFFAAEYLIKFLTIHYRREYKGIGGKIRYFFSF